MTNEWRRVVASLANDERRRVFAGLVLGVDVDVTPSRRAKALAALADAGLVTLHPGGEASLVETAFAELLALEPEVKREGVERFIRDGRIDQYPAKPALRAELLGWAAARVLQPGEELDERALNERLEGIADDVASLRRYLVDAGLLDRAPDGSSYRRV